MGPGRLLVALHESSGAVRRLELSPVEWFMSRVIAAVVPVCFGVIVMSAAATVIQLLRSQPHPVCKTVPAGGQVWLLFLDSRLPPPSPTMPHALSIINA